MNKVHIGEAIKQKVKERGFKVAEFADRLHCDRTNVYAIFHRENIDMELLMRISHILEYSFIEELYQCRQKKYLIVLEVDEQ
jgi:transcriptional regulator with XRE-family HTH domain